MPRRSGDCGGTVPHWRQPGTVSRREFLRTSILAGGVMCAPFVKAAVGNKSDSTHKAQVAISLDLEMARNFPHWEDTHWDYEKGNLTEDTKAYALEAARRVKARGGRIH